MPGAKRSSAASLSKVARRRDGSRLLLFVGRRNELCRLGGRTNAAPVKSSTDASVKAQFGKERNQASKVSQERTIRATWLFSASDPEEFTLVSHQAHRPILQGLPRRVAVQDLRVCA